MRPDIQGGTAPLGVGRCPPALGPTRVRVTAAVGRSGRHPLPWTGPPTGSQGLGTPDACPAFDGGVGIGRERGAVAHGLDVRVDGAGLDGRRYNPSCLASRRDRTAAEQAGMGRPTGRSRVFGGGRREPGCFHGHAPTRIRLPQVNPPLAGTIPARGCSALTRIRKPANAPFRSHRSGSQGLGPGHLRAMPGQAASGTFGGGKAVVTTATAGRVSRTSGPRPLR